MSKPPVKLGTPPPPAKQSDGKTPVWAPGVKPPQDWIDREKRRADFIGYLLVGGPLDGDFVRFENKIGQRPVIKLDRAPRPGWPNSSSTGDPAAIDDYFAESFEPIRSATVSHRFYRHKSITVHQALNRLLLWYLPPETRPSLDAQAVQAMAAQLAAADELPDPDTCEHVFEDCLREREFGASRTIEKRCRNCHQWQEP